MALLININRNTIAEPPTLFGNHICSIWNSATFGAYENVEFMTYINCM